MASRTLTSGKTLNVHAEFVKRTLEDLDSDKKSHNATLRFFYLFIYLFFVDIN